MLHLMPKVATCGQGSFVVRCAGVVVCAARLGPCMGLCLLVRPVCRATATMPAIRIVSSWAAATVACVPPERGLRWVRS